eukprot:CAMPEP_0175098986 /NCGR_PEP_ID=MMETSP0086_2-20121207/6185_1 /TAXON_ID=136419 /ORGANISM="Unknown Unknown, Strain D1" /LENGTH=264 /DNA_ID=CAMNT_0016372745 /DNA_START=38 /DNA_END=832 /DNA_ORIENTATION=-
MSTPEHQSQVINLLKFYRNKMTGRQADIANQFDDLKGMSLLDQMFTRAELERIIDGIRDMVKGNCLEEINNFTTQNVLFLKHLFMQAEGFGQTLPVEQKCMDDGQQLAAIGSIDLDTVNIGSGEGSSPADAALIIKINDLKEQLDRVRSRTHKLSAQVDRTRNENHALQSEAEALESELAVCRQDLGGGDANQKEIDSLRAQLHQLQQRNAQATNAIHMELLPLKEELSDKVTRATQYKQFKKMIEDKNRTIRDLQVQLDEQKQ